MKERFTESKLLKLPPSLMSRLNRVSGSQNVDASEVIRRGLISELDRMEAQASIESQRMEKLQRVAAASGVDVDVVLERMLRDTVEPELPLPAGAPG